MSAKYVSPKLMELSKWAHIDKVNEMLDSGISAAAVCKWINSQGFKISAPLVYSWKEKREQAVIEDLNVESIINPISKDTLFKGTSSAAAGFAATKDKVKNELDVLDDIVQRGFKTLVDNDLPVSPQLTIKAIETKNAITKGAHEHLTNAGIAELKAVEQGKFQAVLEALLKFVPQDQLDKALMAIDEAEDRYYKGTTYYEEYLANKRRQLESEEPDILD